MKVYHKKIYRKSPEGWRLKRLIKTGANAVTPKLAAVADERRAKMQVTPLLGEMPKAEGSRSS